MSTKLALGSSASTGPTAWTPSLTFQTPGTYSVSGLTVDGVYQQVGNLVFFDFRVSGTPTMGTASGLAVLSLPLPIASVSGSNLVGVLGGNMALLTGVSLPAGTIEVFPDLGTPGTSVTSIAYQTATTQGALGATHFTTGVAFSLRGGGRYYTP